MSDARSWSTTANRLSDVKFPTGEEALAVVREIDPAATLDITYDSFEFHCAPEKAPACLAALTAFLKSYVAKNGLYPPRRAPEARSPTMRSSKPSAGMARSCSASRLPRRRRTSTSRISRTP